MKRVILLAMVGLAGCETAEQRQAAYQGRCEGYGFKAGTDGMAGCIMKLDQTREAELMASFQRSMDSLAHSRDTPEFVMPRAPKPVGVLMDP